MNCYFKLPFVGAIYFETLPKADWSKPTIDKYPYERDIYWGKFHLVLSAWGAFRREKEFHEERLKQLEALLGSLTYTQQEGLHMPSGDISSMVQKD